MVFKFFEIFTILALHSIGFSNTGYVEIVDIDGCESCKLMLTCRHLTSVIAILEADFIPDKNSSVMVATAFPPMHPRDALNHRCSGVNHCSFIFTEDCPGSEYLGPGKVYIKYACITEDRIKKYCNTEILLPENYTRGLSEGFIHNPGYPRFYSGQRTCKWKLTAHLNQKIRITILDLSLIVDNVKSPEDCTDTLDIRDTGQIIFSTCQQTYPPYELTSPSESVEIILNSSDKFNPRRGVLMHYTVVGCPDFIIPKDTYLVYKTKDEVVLSCCFGYVFPDTGMKIKAIKCLGAFWNTSMPLIKCQKAEEGTSFNSSIIEVIRTRKAQAMSSDLIVPVALITVLFVINAIIIYYIQMAKKRQNLNEAIDEELGTFVSSPVES